MEDNHSEGASARLGGHVSQGWKFFWLNNGVLGRILLGPHPFLYTILHSNAGTKIWNWASFRIRTTTTRARGRSKMSGGGFVHAKEPQFRALKRHRIALNAIKLALTLRIFDAP